MKNILLVNRQLKLLCANLVLHLLDYTSLLPKKPRCGLSLIGCKAYFWKGVNELGLKKNMYYYA